MLQLYITTLPGYKSVVVGLGEGETGRGNSVKFAENSSEKVSNRRENNPHPSWEQIPLF